MSSELAKCPWCNRKLEHGIFRSRGGNYFLPDGSKAPSLYTMRSMEKENAIYLANRPEAYVCRDCKKIIIPYSFE